MRVQSLVQAGLAEIPSQYIQPHENRPIVKKENGVGVMDIPVIDLFGFDLNHRDLVRKAIGEACREWGAFHVTNHGVPIELMNQIRSVGLSFFNDCPFKDKLKYACDPTSAASEGYGSKMLVDNCSVLDWRDYFDHHTLPLSRRNPSRWPNFLPNYRCLQPFPPWTLILPSLFFSFLLCHLLMPLYLFFYLLAIWTLSWSLVQI